MSTGNKKHKEWKSYPGGGNDRDYVIRMLQDILLEERKRM